MDHRYPSIGSLFFKLRSTQVFCFYVRGDTWIQKCWEPLYKNLYFTISAKRTKRRSTGTWTFANVEPFTTTTPPQLLPPQISLHLTFFIWLSRQFLWQYLSSYLPQRKKPSEKFYTKVIHVFPCFIHSQFLSRSSFVSFYEVFFFFLRGSSTECARDRDLHWLLPMRISIFGLHLKVMLPQHIYACNFVVITLVCPTKVIIMKLKCNLLSRVWQHDFLMKQIFVSSIFLSENKGRLAKQAGSRSLAHTV